MWFGTKRSDEELKQVQFIEGQKIYDLRVLPSDPDPDVTWEKDPSVEVQTAIGTTNSGFSIPTRQESGVDVSILTPVLTDGVGSQLKQGLASSPDASLKGECRSSKPMEQSLAVGALLNRETPSQLEHDMFAAGGAPTKGESGSAGGSA